jgi:GAF domain-containing protein
MPAAPKPDNEEERLAALGRYCLLDTPPEADFDDLTRLAAFICQTPIAVVNLIDRDRQFFKAEVGLGVRQTPLPASLCAHAILQPDLFVIPDTREDARFADNPLVTGDPFLRFYAGALLQTADGHALGTLCVLDHEPRSLSGEQKDALRVLARQVMTLIEGRLAASEQAQMLREAQARVKREALINQIGEVVRAAREPADVLRSVVEALGASLGADRCYYVTYDLEHVRGRIETDWYRKDAGLSSMAGEYQLSDYAVNHDAGYHSGQTQVVEDVHEHAQEMSLESDSPPVTLMDKLGLRALLRAPILSGGVMTVLAVAMAKGPRQWTTDEVRLVETIAAQTRAAVEAARIQMRERTIAQQLQAALQPPPTPNLPGLALEGFYRPALLEAGVGGDFYDVFSVEKGCTALVVADLSGKGLVAASEVAMVRNMLRHALYSHGTTLADAVGNLSQILVEHNLLRGFATLFVGLYDQNERTLTYVNCGQEPGLLWRAVEGRIEELSPTGPVLGGFHAGAFTEVVVPLSPGDILALFTDGLTEVGPTRRDLLEIAGLSALLRECCTEASTPTDPESEAKSIAASVLSRLVAGVDAYARGGRPDDMCLLVGVVTGGGASL